jgi:5-methyltetrahydrofolate--homocysteine methyltransferase
VVLACNNYEVIDLGVMVPAERILQTAAERGAGLIGLSGLITPSLDEMVHVATEMQRQGLQLPLLIGGATTSRKHTAIRIAPRYEGLTVHVTDASRAVDVLSRISGAEMRADYERRVRDEQQADRERFEGARPTELRPYAEAVEARLVLDWDAGPPEPPAFLGTRVLGDHPLEDLVPYIDWTPFFHVWELRGVYPRILDDPQYGAAARELYDAARRMLERIVGERGLHANGVYGFFPANSEGDDIVVYDDENREHERARLPMLRQQHTRRDGRACLSLADFLAPRSGPHRDYLGAFAVTTGLGLDELVAALEREHDDYGSILAKSLADRLAEAFAERLHEIARREWGYGQHERLSKDDLLRERYRGIRPAAGYPASPDHSQKRILWNLLDVDRNAEIHLTESCAMLPAASVSGLYFSHPQARYFAVGKISREQVEAYARRSGKSLEEVERWLSPNLAYPR